jgi:hypothetical protein
MLIFCVDICHPFHQNLNHLLRWRWTHEPCKICHNHCYHYHHHSIYLSVAIAACSPLSPRRCEPILQYALLM